MIRFTRKVATTYQRNTKRSIATDMYRSNIYIYRSISFIHHKEARGTRFSFGSIHHVALCRSTSCWYYTHNIVQVDGYTGTPIVRQILDPFILWGGLRNNSRSIPRDWRVDQNNVSCLCGDDTFR